MTPEQLELGAEPEPSSQFDPEAPPPTPEQRRAIEARDRDVLLEAGAGTGKTKVLVERFCAAAEEAETGVDSILAFTFTERAAGELRHRIRDELAGRAERARSEGEVERAEHLRDLARDSERAWISTIHGFCRRILAGHPVALGLDPRFRVLDAGEADRVASAAFDEALEELLDDPDAERATLVAAMRAPELRRLVGTAYAELRSQGRTPALPEAPQSDATAALAALVSAAKAACSETEGGGGGPGNLERIAAAAALEPDARLPTETELAGLELTSKARAFSGTACAAYKEAWRAARTALAERQARASYQHIAQLLELFAAHYRRLKQERSGLDFEDLQLEARRLLGEYPRVAQAYRERFRHILVDEFQDTNRLQLELVRLLRGPETRTFLVGDEFQSVYGFRHADLEVFRGECERIAALPERDGEVMRLGGNFRSTPAVVSAVNAIGEAILGGFRELTVGREPGDGESGDGPAVELLLTPAGSEWDDEGLDINLSGDYPSAPDRVAEARFLATELRRLVDDEGVAARDIVVLIRAYTHVAAFEEELERAGLRPYVVGGRGYWSQQQVDDVIRLIATIANPLDDACLLGVLASPLCGVGADALWLLRRAAGPGRHLWPVIERRFGRDEPDDEPESESERHLAAIPDDDAASLRELCDRLASLRADAPLIGLDELIQRAVTTFDYDLATLIMERGTRRYANVRKLMRLARGYEAAEGRDIRGFLDFVADSAALDREGEAATEAEDHDGVRVMTVHAAKGLEFSVVAVADLGRGLLAGVRQPPVAIAHETGSTEDRPSDDGPRVGIRLARLGTTAVGVFGYDEMIEEAAEDEAAESCRLAYVAATRAQERLILSGRFHAGRLAKADEDMPASTPITERLMRAMAIDPEAEDHVVELAPPEPRPGLAAGFGAGRLAVRFNRPDPAAFNALRRASVPEGAEAGEPLAPPPLGRPTAETQPAARHLSYSALATYGRCGYRFFSERVVGLPAREDLGTDADRAPARSRFGFGNAVHHLLEWSARNGWGQPDGSLCARVVRREVPDAGPADVDRARAMVCGWLESDLCAELRARGGARPEMPFILRLGDSVVRGTIDLYSPGEVPLVVDYKTDAVGSQGLDEVVDRYGVQRQIYALAAAQRASAVRTAYVFLERPDEAVEVELDRAALDASGRELEALIAGIRDGSFQVTETPHRALCWDCPARARLCSHSLEATGKRLR